jgi:hypothetical protein
VNFRSANWQCKVHAIITEAVTKIHTNTTAIRPTGEPVFKVIDHNNRKQLGRLDSLPMQLQSRGLRVCTVAFTGGTGLTAVKLRGQRCTHKEDYDSLVNGRQFLDRAETGKHGSS